MAVPEALSQRDLNRALLARQMLLKRERVGVLAAVERLAGLQAQVPRAPFIGLWSRLEGFERERLAELLRKKKAVRATMMRGTIHVASRKDFIAFRNVIQPVLAQVARSQGQLRGADVDKLVAAGRKVLDKRPLALDALRKALREIPGVDEAAVVRAVQFFLPLVRVPDDSPWSHKANAAFAPAGIYLNEPLGTKATAGDLMLRYLAAFGPATVADAQTWSGLRTLKPVFDSLRPKLVVFRDDRKRELFDLKAAPRPAGDSAAPVRFLPDFDNLLLSHADKSRVISKEHAALLKSPNGIGVPTFLVDGFVAGRWKVERAGKTATIEMKPFVRLNAASKDALAEEGERLAAFVEPDAERWAIRFAR